MTDVLYVGDRALRTDEIPTLLKRYELLPKFVEELAIDDAIAEYECTPEEKQQALLEICQKNQLANVEQQQQWMDDRGLNAREVELMATRSIRIQKYKEATWGKKVRRHFMDRKSGLDVVTYSLIRTQDVGLANELYYRLQEGEVSFEECAAKHSQGPEARTNGKLGPVPLNRPHPLISKLLSVSQPGQLWPPRTIPNSDWQVIIRLEEFVPAQLDDRMRQALLDDLYNTWLKERVKELTTQALSPQYQIEAAERAAAPDAPIEPAEPDAPAEAAASDAPDNPDPSDGGANPPDDSSPPDGETSRNADRADGTSENDAASIAPQPANESSDDISDDIPEEIPPEEIPDEIPVSDAPGSPPANDPPANVTSDAASDAAPDAASDDTPNAPTSLVSTPA